MRLPSLLFFIITDLLISSSFVLPARAQQVKIYVSANGNDRAAGSFTHPVKTLQQAQQLARAARELDTAVPVTVFLRGGTYYLDSSLVFTSKDNASGDASVSYQSYLHEKAIISGGRRLHLKWTPWRNGIYRARLTAAFDFDQLFVNGIGQVRARYPNYNSAAAIFDGVSRNALSPARIKSWLHPAGGFIHALQRYHWGSLHYRITGKNADGSLKLEGGYQINRSHTIDSNNVFAENIFEELDTAHEWYYDHSTGILYYMPPKGLDLQKAKIEVPVLMEIVIFNGDTSHPVGNIHFEGLSFTYTKETFMLTREPLLRGDWNIFRGGAVLLNGTENCSFSNCDFESPGGNAVFFNNYNRFDTIEHCLITNAGASGICFVGDPLAVRSPSFNYDQYVPYDQLDKKPGPRSRNFPQDCYVYDNLIRNTGRVEKQTAGVELSMCMNIQIMHNTIYHVPRAGININDGTWGGHVIEDNAVFETVLETGDHGAFNSWGRDRYWSPDRHYMDSLVAVHPELVKLDVIHPITIRHNLFRCDRGWDIDLDDGSTNYLIDSNLCLNGGIKLREGFYRTIENNIMVNNTFHPHVWFKNSHVVFRHNIVMKPYAPIQIAYWGDSIDYNLFPDTAALSQAQANGTDINSAVGFPNFYDPSKGDYRVSMNEAIRSTGFQNFSMDDFGVISPRLKAMSRHPVFPVPNRINRTGQKGELLKWEGAMLKNVSGAGEQSALGLPKAEGVYIVKIQTGSIAEKAGFRENDVILKIETLPVNNLHQFQQAVAQLKHLATMHFLIYRNQQVMKIVQ